MARNPLPYTTKNNLSSYLSLRKAEKQAEKGDRVLIREVEDELADYCDVTRDTIVMIKRGLNQPSLSVALKICEYFNVSVEEIFSLVVSETD